MNRTEINAEVEGEAELLFAALADEFVDRLNRGERPDIEPYACRNPEFAKRIRETFPLLTILRPLTDPPPSQPEGPLLLSGFRIVRCLGRGGMGVVYEAVQEALGRHVAVKVMSASARNNSIMTERFRREASAAARLHHTHIVPIFQVGDGEILFYAMQLIRGATLNEVIQRRREISAAPTCVGSTVPDEQATRGVADAASMADAHDAPPANSLDYFRSVARWGSQAADALDHAHTHGILHRDIKPSNLMLDEHGMIWVTDFGLAKLHDAVDLTEAGTIVGTIRYLAPECLSGNAEKRSDIYSFGMTLYELLTLRPAFDETDAQKLMRLVAEATPAQPRTLDHRIPRDLETIVLKCIQRSPQHRYATARDLMDDLQRFVDGKTIAARRASPVEQVWRWSRRNPMVASLLGALMLALTVIVGGAVFTALSLNERSRKIELELQRSERAEAEERAARTGEAAARHEAQQTAWRSLLAQGSLAIRDPSPGRPQRVGQILNDAGRILPDISVSAEELARFRSLIAEAQLVPEIVAGARWACPVPTAQLSSASRDGLAVAIDASHSACVYRIGDQRPIWMAPAHEDNQLPLSPTLSRDGACLALSFSRSASANGCEIWKVGDTRAHVWIPKANRVMFSADSRRALCSGSKANAPVIVDLSAKVPALTPLPWLDISAHMCLSDDGQFIADVSSDGAFLRVRRVSDGSVMSNMSLAARVLGIAWFPDSKRLAIRFDTRGTAHPISIYSIPHRTELARLSHPENIRGFAISPSGAWVASLADDQLLRVWNASNGELAASLQLSHHFSLTFGATDRELLAATVRGEYTRLHIRNSEIYQRMDRFASGSMFAPAANLDARWLVVRERGPNVLATLWDLESNRAIGVLSESQNTQGLTADWERRRVLGFAADRGRWHCMLWTISDDGDGQAIGAPKRFHLEAGERFGATGIVMSGDGRTLASSFSASIRPGDPASTTRDSFRAFSLPDLWEGRIVDKAGPLLVHVPQPGKQVDQAHGWLELALSRDGHWLALAIPQIGVNPGRAQANVIWDLSYAAPQAVDVAYADGQPRALCFSPDSRWLIEGTTTEYVLRRVGTWEIIHRIPLQDPRKLLATAAFSPDHKLVALCTRKGRVALHELATGKEWAELSLKENEAIASLGFAVGGEKLIAVSTSSVVHVWDLRKTHAELAKWRVELPSGTLSPGRMQ